jgi:glycosyltransferase involved in cell wall biosynthesis
MHGMSDKDILQTSLKLTNSLSTLINFEIRIANKIFYFQRGVLSCLFNGDIDKVVLAGPNINLPNNLFLALICKVINVDVIWYSHGISKHNRLNRVIQILFIYLSKGMLVYGRAAKLDILTSPIVRNKPLYAIGNCVNYEPIFTDLDKTPIDHTRGLKLLFVGRLNHNKRGDIIIRAVERLISLGFKVEAKLVGGGKCYNEYQSIIDSLDMGSVISMDGELYEDDLYAVFKWSNLFILPGKCGLSIVEAMCHGLPVVTVESGTIHSPEIELLKPGVNGLFFDNLNVDSVVQVLSKVADYNFVPYRIKKSVIDMGYIPSQVADNVINALK